MLIDQQRATQVLSFVELLLKFIYEFPARVAGGPPTPGVQASQTSDAIDGAGA